MVSVQKKLRPSCLQCLRRDADVIDKALILGLFFLSGYKIGPILTRRPRLPSAAHCGRIITLFYPDRPRPIRDLNHVFTEAEQ